MLWHSARFLPTFSKWWHVGSQNFKMGDRDYEAVVGPARLPAFLPLFHNFLPTWSEFSRLWISKIGDRDDSGPTSDQHGAPIKMQIQQALANLYWIIFIFISIIVNIVNFKIINYIIFIITGFRMQILPAVAKLYWMIHIGPPLAVYHIILNQTLPSKHSFLYFCISLQFCVLYFSYLLLHLCSPVFISFTYIHLYSAIFTYLPCSFVVHPNKLHPHTWFISDAPDYI